jgi:hypothetical protein
MTYSPLAVRVMDMRQAVVDRQLLTPKVQKSTQDDLIQERMKQMEKEGDNQDYLTYWKLTHHTVFDNQEER